MKKRKFFSADDKSPTTCRRRWRKNVEMQMQMTKIDKQDKEWEWPHIWRIRGTSITKESASKQTLTKLGQRSVDALILWYVRIGVVSHSFQHLFTYTCSRSIVILTWLYSMPRLNGGLCHHRGVPSTMYSAGWLWSATELSQNSQFWPP